MSWKNSLGGKHVPVAEPDDDQTFPVGGLVRSGLCLTIWLRHIAHSRILNNQSLPPQDGVCFKNYGSLIDPCVQTYALNLVGIQHHFGWLGQRVTVTGAIHPAQNLIYLRVYGLYTDIIIFLITSCFYGNGNPQHWRTSLGYLHVVLCNGWCVIWFPYSYFCSTL